MVAKSSFNFPVKLICCKLSGFVQSQSLYNNFDDMSNLTNSSNIIICLMFIFNSVYY